MPKSRLRKKKVYTPPTDIRPAGGSKSRKPSPRWLPVVAVGFIVAAIAWLVTYYMSQGSYPIEQIGAWNLAVGFGMFVASLGIFTQWR